MLQFSIWQAKEFFSLLSLVFGKIKESSKAILIPIAIGINSEPNRNTHANFHRILILVKRKQRNQLAADQIAAILRNGTNN